MTRAFAIFLPLLIAMLAAAPAYAADMTIDGRCSLSEAIDNANADEQVHSDCPAGSGHDIISFAWDITVGRHLVIESEITIQGGGTLSGGNSGRMFYVKSNGTLTLKNLTLRDGKADEISCPEHRDGRRRGGAIFNLGALNIVDSFFSGNSAPFGGAIYNCRGARLNISDTVFSGNSAEQIGGAIYNCRGARLNISDTVFSGNSAEQIGGAIYNWGEASISGSAFSGNGARYSGGAIYNRGEASISGSQFSDNSARDGGAIWNHDDGEVLLARNHFSDNSPDDCYQATCVSRPLSEMKTIQDDSQADEPPPSTDDAPPADDPAPTTAMPNPSLLAVEHVACTPDDIYLILTLKSDTPDSDRLFEVQVSAEGSARILDIAPLPKTESLPERLASVTAIALIGDGLDVVTGFPLAGSIFIAGAELYQWIDEQFTSGGGPLSFRLTWYNTSVHPGITRWLVHATRSGAGNLRISTRLAPLSEIASFTRDAATDDTFSTGVKDSIDVALYMMGGGLAMADEAVGSGQASNLLGGGAKWLIDLADSATDLLGRAADTDLAEKAIDWLTTPAEWALDTLVTNPVAYWSERFFTNAGETTAPVAVC